MIYLCLAILSSTLVSVLMRIGSQGEEARKPMLAINYMTCMLVSLCIMHGFVWQGPGIGAVLGIGLPAGIFYLAAFLLLQTNVRTNGVSLSSAFMKLGVIVPVILGITCFGERLSLSRLAGILLTVSAILVLSGRQPGQQRRQYHLLILLMFCGGMADGSSKIYDACGVPELQGQFLFTAFGVAMLLCVLVCMREHQTPNKRDWGLGVMLGIPNYFSSLFLLWSLTSVPASVAFPVFSCGTILFLTLIGHLVFRETLEKRQQLSLGLVLAALVCLNI